MHALHVYGNTISLKKYITLYEVDNCKTVQQTEWLPQWKKNTMLFTSKVMLDNFYTVAIDR